jgi:hypothetical protein
MYVVICRGKCVSNGLWHCFSTVLRVTTLDTGTRSEENDMLVYLVKDYVYIMSPMECISVILS